LPWETSILTTPSEYEASNRVIVISPNRGNVVPGAVVIEVDVPFWVYLKVVVPSGAIDCSFQSLRVGATGDRRVRVILSV